ncbi:MAG TPA: PLDc N-terminal domain-containing protein [Humibacillus xanthopallidus]|nr:PLDc N-terminal domain-containing protein [Humibacillus xanthopallidus]
MLRVVFIAIVVFATIYALVDCVQTDRRQVRVMPKPVWLLAVLVPVAGPLAWFFAGRAAARGGGPTRGSGGRPTGPLGPDDDPDFLRRL